MMGKFYLFVFPLVFFLLVVPRVQSVIAQDAEHNLLQISADTLVSDSLSSGTASGDTLTEPIIHYQWLGPHQLPADKHFQQDEITAVENNLFVTAWILLSIILIGICKWVFPIRFREVLLAAWKSRFYNQLEREAGVFTNWVSFFLFVNFLLSLTLLFYQLLLHYEYIYLFPAAHPGFILIYILTFTAAYIILKFLVIYLSGWIFKTIKPAESAVRTTLTGNYFTGVLLLPILIINYYNPHSLILFMAVAILLLMTLFKLIKISFIGLSMRSFSTYHLILYLCTIEIAPLLFLIKYSSNITQ
jgi:hypothetical protein